MFQISSKNFPLHVTVLKFVGISLSGSEPSWYCIYSAIFLTIFVYLPTILVTYELYVSYWDGNLNAFATILSYQMTHLLGAAKVFMLLYHRKKLTSILQTLEFEPFTANKYRGGDWEEKVLNKVKKSYNTQTLIYYGIATSVCSSGVAHAISTRLTETSDNWQFPFIPFSLMNTTVSPSYEIICSYQSICTTIYAYIISTVDCFIVAVMAFLVAQLYILQQSFKKILLRARNMEKKIEFETIIENNENLEDNNMDISSVSTKYLNKCLKDSVEHHTKILKVCSEFESIINILILIVFLGSVILLCFLLFQTSMTPVASIEFLQSCTYCIVITFQLFLYCWWGNEITFESEKIMNSLREINFTGTALSFQKSLIIIMSRVRKPIVFTAGKFSPLSLETYRAILQGSFSYYMILHQLSEPPVTE